MPRTGLWIRIFIGLLVAVLLPIVIVVGALIVFESLLAGVDPNLIGVAVVAGVIGWAAVLAIVYERVLADDLRTFLRLAERGGPVTGTEPGAAFHQVAGALEERNRQVAALASESASIPIDDEPRTVVAAVVSATRSVMGDSTWRCAILTSAEPGLLPAGSYSGLEDERAHHEIEELERWASVSGAEATASRVEGPWGAFAVVILDGAEAFSGILYAPWEGRADPTPAEIALLTLVGQHATTALEHSLLYARVRNQADELNRLAAVQTDFLRGVTHDLQTPLTSIGALATELRSDAATTERARQDLETIAHQADRLRRMVSQLLVASRLEAGVLTPRVEVFAVPPIVERTWAALRSDRPFTLDVKGTPHLAIGDPDRLEQVLWALLDNAVKYSPDGSPITVHVEPDDGQLRISVEDNGMGMDAVARARAFEQFFRSDEARRMAPDGSGVGLYAARGIIEAMGGAVSVASELGAGTRIAVAIPAERSDAGD